MAIPLALVGALAGGFPGLYKFGSGLLGQSQYGKVKRPPMETPKGVTEAEDIYKYLAGQEMPGTAAYEQKVLSNQEALLNKLENNVESGAALLGAAPNIVARTNENLQDITTVGANYRRENARNLAAFQGGTKTGWQAKEWEWNKAQPYLADQEAKQRANLNVYEGFSDMLGGAFKGYTGGKLVDAQKESMQSQQKSFKNWINSLSGNKNTSTNELEFSNNVELNPTNSWKSGMDWNSLTPSKKGWQFINGEWRFI